MADPAYLPPRCPDCEFPMVFITVDMTEQGGPPENTWLCHNQACGRAIRSYDPREVPTLDVCVPPRGGA